MSYQDALLALAVQAPLVDGPLRPAIGDGLGALAPAADITPAAAGASRPKPGSWATEERRAYLREAWPADVPLDQIMPAMAAMDGPPLPAVHALRSYVQENLQVKRSSPRALAIKSAKEGRRYRSHHKKRVVAPAPVEVFLRGTPGIALPPISYEWHEIVAIALNVGAMMQNKYDLPGFNRQRVARGQPPLAIKMPPNRKSIGAWR